MINLGWGIPDIDTRATEKRNRARGNFAKIIEAVADDIKQHGFTSLWDDDQFITGGRIIVEINDEMIPSITYEKSVFPKGAVK